ncbi:MAG: FAD-dependent oxidoreductase [Patescibacteria group bacterium]|nr:FAD-dependent oxidoreductase [Patescibacteria group bacterium]
MHDLIIVGAGPAGLSASIYASRYGIDHLIIGESMGGTIAWAHKVDNFPGLPGLTGGELAQKIADHAKSLGVEIKAKEVSKIEKTDGGFSLTTSDGESFETRAVIIATGTRRRELGVRGEKTFAGKGVSYCTTCDAPFFKGKIVAVVGGANAACSGVVHISDFAKQVFLLYRKSNLRAEKAWIDELKKKDNVEILYETNVSEIKGSDKVERIILDKDYNGKKELEVDGVFIEIGGVPAAALIKELRVECDEAGYVKTDEKMKTNIKGIFSAGDINSTNREFQQVVVACSEGAIASFSAYNFLKK